MGSRVLHDVEERHLLVADQGEGVGIVHVQFIGRVHLHGGHRKGLVKRNGI